ncbi:MULTISPECIES: preprotein translocase subunit SecE [Legionella]|uniref:Protein translocase subunit SecE n=1 Tax=Legionella septentrionalis TaxID=2498109 RepID=A0A3S0V9F1_9GAMM|nr:MULTISPECIES: preprotein translocase subunit SecE [Legionella]MCP0913797.1 preprotein translocase subunit SecE [Legionella sp. 27cVA30]RUQ80623.1 preprotein translocase subunit SecE [Legionella septentrionalis]RUQ98646.1 preprotein translocase subunit SecE [Legionella septentrionalis]RUR08697.1 preprotein translocase subunit SecE [Legionella septentrionalis]RUR13216.1 preprotein translocase subunit SecE [Legionella septentrionalis]
MKEINKSRIQPHEIASWIGIVLVTVAAFFGTYYFHFSGPIKALIWVGWLVLIFALAFFTSQGQKVFSFSKEAKTELQKVVWPTRQETVQTTSIVMIMVAVTGFILWGIDTGMMWVIGKITHLG